MEANLLSLEAIALNSSFADINFLFSKLFFINSFFSLLLLIPPHILSTKMYSANFPTGLYGVAYDSIVFIKVCPFFSPVILANTASALSIKLPVPTICPILPPLPPFISTNASTIFGNEFNIKLNICTSPNTFAIIINATPKSTTFEFEKFGIGTFQDRFTPNAHCDNVCSQDGINSLKYTGKLSKSTNCALTVSANIVNINTVKNIFAALAPKKANQFIKKLCVSLNK